MTYGYIYKITNIITGMKYIGQTTKPIEVRFEGHCKEKRNRHISNAIRKYGRNNFKLEKIAEAKNQEELNELEKYHVEMEKCLHPFGYNHRAGGNQNGICSDELKNKISAAKLNRPNLKRRGEVKSEQYRIKISRGLGGKKIKSTNLETGEIKIYETAHSTKKDGHNPSNVVSICKNNSYRTHSKGWKFEYIIEELYDNQSGSTETKESGHAQRIGTEPEKSSE